MILQKLPPTKFVHKLYVNENVGLPGGKSVITLPLYSELQAQRASLAYITWCGWQPCNLADKTEDYATRMTRN
jgi:hypothetical protein